MTDIGGRRMTDTSREAVERLLQDVTPGPWKAEYKHGNMRLLMGNDCQMCDMTYYPWTPDEPADWEFIAAARDLVPTLLARAEAAEKKLADAVEKFAALENAASNVARRGAETGPQWTRLTIALLASRAALAEINGDSHE